MILSRYIYLLAIGFVLAATVNLRAQGTLYIANYGGQSIDTVNSSGTLTTLVPDSNFPQFLAVDSSGNVYASLIGSNVVEKYSSTGTDLGPYASGFNTPQGLAFDSSGDLFVANSSNSNILKITSDGTKSTFESDLNFPVDVAINSQGNIFVGVLGTSSINVYNPGGTLLQTITSGVFNPGQLAFDSAGDLFVTNQGANGSGDYSIEEYTASLNGTVSTAAQDFVNTGSEFQPLGLAIDQNNNLYVSFPNGDGGDSPPIIEKYSSTGTDLGVFASGGDLSAPQGLDFVPAAAPEPATWALFLLGLPVLVLLLRRKA